MTTSLRHRRRADRFAQLLEEASGGRRQHRRDPLDEELTELVALRRRLVSTTWVPAINPEFQAGLRAMLVATAEREGIGASARPVPDEPAPRAVASRPQSRIAWALRAPRARTAMVAGVAVGAVAFTGMSTASENAMPGDALYGVKRSTERAQLALASSDVGRGALYLGFAQTRAAEARLLGGDLERVLDDMDNDASQGVRLLTTAATSREDLAALDLIDEFVAEQRTALAALAAQVGGTDATRVQGSMDLLERIEARSDELREYLDECAGTPATSLDSLGPIVPPDCVALPAPSTIDLAPELTERPTQPSQDRPVMPNPDTQADEPTTSAPGTPQPADDEPSVPVLGDLPVGGEPDQPPADAEPATPGEDETADDGLLTGLNRLLGNLLGG
jgi:hypothetical protein